MGAGGTIIQPPKRAMSASLPILRQAQIDTIFNLLGAGQCCAVYGLSNTGKSPLMRALALPENQRRYLQRVGDPGALIYVDCNRVLELSATGFYEIIVRTLLEFIEEPGTPPQPTPELLAQLREYHNRITTGPAFQASLAFNSALSETCGQLGLYVVLLLDEFDEIYAALEDRSLLNLRALKDHSRSRLTYVTATVRPLSESRKPGDNEFAELFAAHTLPLGRLDEEDARRVVESLAGTRLPPEAVDNILRLAGGHYGLLAALTQAALRAPDRGRDARHLAGDTAARAECLKLWNQLRPEEQAAAAGLLAPPGEGPAAARLEPLRQLGLVVQSGDGPRLFTELFESFVRRQSALPSQATPGVVVDEDAGEVWVDGARVTLLTDLEYRLMRLLYERRDRLTTKDMIVEVVWGGEYLDRVDDARIEKLVSRLRSKIEPDPAHPRYLLTQRGRGYKLSSEPMARDEADES
jgi:DNA-binding winged helix-turn-helix (wHTH) protein